MLGGLVRQQITGSDELGLYRFPKQAAAQASQASNRKQGG